MGETMKRRKKQREVDRELLDAIFRIEAEWKRLRNIVDNGIDPVTETRQKLGLVEARYMFLIKEAKLRKVSLLRY